MENTQTQKLFGRWDYAEIQIEDICFRDYIAAISQKSQVTVPHTAGRWQQKKFRKVQCPIVERLVDCLMYHGRNTGKKILAIKIVREAFEIINLMTGKNPLQVLINAVSNGGAREDSTRIGSGGQVKKQAIDVSPMRRVSQSLYYMAMGARNATMKNYRSMSECLADELMNCEKMSPNSYAIKKKDEIEKVAKGNR